MDERSISPVELSAAHLTTCWARLLMHSLWSAGVEHFVISPGSRSTPFTWAALQLGKQQGAPGQPAAQLHIVLDERSAGFMALGIARNSGTPAVLLCTSGSAAANYFPAIVEARAAGIPLLVLTADRPLELQHAGAAQTLDQIKLYGDQSVGFFELGAPDPSPLALRSLMRMARQAVGVSLGPTPGPVQLNARAKKPLEPEPTGALAATIDALLTSGAGDPALGPAYCRADHYRTDLLASSVQTKSLAQRMLASERGAILCGPLAPWQAARPETLRRVLELSGFTLWHEATSNVGLSAQPCTARRFDTWLREPSARAALWPDFALQLGPLPTSGSLIRLLESQALERHVWCPFGYQDPASRSSRVLTVDLEGSLLRLIADLEGERAAGAAPRARADYHALLGQVELACAEASARAARSSTENVPPGQSEPSSSSEPPGESAQLSEATAINCILDHLPESCLLSLGNSLAVREVDWFRTGTMPTRVLSQRGLNGIDGTVSGALGAALTHPGPSAVLLGDLSLIHDLGSLASAKFAKQPMLVVVINNAGGRIFEMLPLASGRTAEELEPWTTPHQLQLRSAAELFGVRYARASCAAEIGPALVAALAEPTLTLLEVQVGPSSSIAAQRVLWREAASSISALNQMKQASDS